MSWLDRRHRERDAQGVDGGTPEDLHEDEAIEAVGDSTSPHVDPDTGEILPARRMTRGSAGAPPGRDAGGASVQGERAIPSVNRERSIQSRISGGLALATILLLGGGFLFWYYNTQYSRSRDAEEAARKATAARAGGEMKVPPLGRIDPPKAPTDATPILTANTLPAPQSAAPPTNAGGPPQKTPEQLALERQLGAPVLRKGQSLTSNAAPYSVESAAPGQSGQPVMPNVAQLFGAMQSPAAVTPTGNTLAANLRPTPTPAVTAQTLPTRRLLLPKGAFIVDASSKLTSGAS